MGSFSLAFLLSLILSSLSGIRCVRPSLPEGGYPRVWVHLRSRPVANTHHAPTVTEHTEHLTALKRSNKQTTQNC